MPDFTLIQMLRAAERMAAEGARLNMPALYGRGDEPGGQRQPDPLVLAIREAGWDAHERPRVVIPAESVFRAPSFPSNQELGFVQGPMTALPADTMYLYPALASAPLAQGDLVIRDYVQTGTRTVTGNVERADPTSTADKATLDVSIDLATDPVAQMAIMVEDVPRAVLDSVPAFNAFLSAEMRLQIDLQTDAHCIQAVFDSSLGQEFNGANLVEAIRNGIASMRDAGAQPNILAVNHQDAARLDLVQDGDGRYLFSSRASGSASPVWNVGVRETSQAVVPVLIDSSLIGVLYQGPAAFFSDAFTGLKRNVVRVLLEGLAKFHIRNAAGALIIAQQS